jgi:uncharacterized protein involved in exopolysaccharide biosynthesis
MSAKWGDAGANDTRQGSLREFCTPIFRHRGKALVLFCVLAGLVIAATFIAPPVYQSEAKLLVRPGREAVAAPPTVGPGEIMYLSRRMEEQLNSELEILRSRQLAEAVVNKVGADKIMAKRATGALVHKLSLGARAATTEAAVQEVVASCGIQALRDTDILQVTFQSQDPALAQKALEDLISAYLDLHVKVYEAGTSFGLFQRQTDYLKDQLTKADEALREFKNKAGISSLHDQRLFLIERTGNMLFKAAGVTADLAGSRASAKSLQDGLGQVDKTVVVEQVSNTPNGFMDTARLKLLDLRVKEKDLLSQYPESSRFVRNVRNQIKQAEDSMGTEEATRTEVKTGVNDPYQKLQFAYFTEKAKLDGLEQTDRTLRAEIGPAEAELRSMIDAETTLTALERQQAVLDASYREYVAKLEDARILQLLEHDKISNIAVVQPATTPIKPVRPRKALNVALGILLGLVGGVSFAFLSEHLDHTFRTTKHVEDHLGIPVLVAIPETRRRALKV